MYEYKVIDYRLDPFEEGLESMIERINNEAKDGWRVINISEVRYTNLLGKTRIWSEAIITYEKLK